MNRPWRARLVGGGLLVLVGLVMFDVPAAYASVRGAPWWLALAVGLVVFPVLPVTWHLVRERKRRVAPPAKSKTTGWERFWFRLLVIGVLVIGALIAFDRSRTWRAVRHHALWMIPTTIEPLDPSSKVLDKVPASAEVIVWLRDTDDAQAMVSQVAPTSFGARELVIAVDGTNVMILETGDASLIDLLVPWYTLIRPGSVTPKVVELPGGVRMWSTPGWPPSTGRATALIEQMRRAPDSAFLVAVTKPRTKKVDEITGAVGWLAVVHGELEAVGEVTAVGPREAMMLWAEGEREIEKSRAKDPAPFACGSASGGSLTYTAYGRVFVARARIAVDQIKPLFECLRP
jgi:hypothetical protein